MSIAARMVGSVGRFVRRCDPGAGGVETRRAPQRTWTPFTAGVTNRSTEEAKRRQEGVGRERCLPVGRLRTARGIGKIRPFAGLGCTHLQIAPRLYTLLFFHISACIYIYILFFFLFFLVIMNYINL